MLECSSLIVLEHH